MANAAPRKAIFCNFKVPAAFSPGVGAGPALGSSEEDEAVEPGKPGGVALAVVEAGEPDGGVALAVIGDRAGLPEAMGGEDMVGAEALEDGGEDIIGAALEAVGAEFEGEETGDFMVVVGAPATGAIEGAEACAQDDPSTPIIRTIAATTPFILAIGREQQIFSDS